jgi:hypothetical protein
LCCWGGREGGKEGGEREREREREREGEGKTEGERGRKAPRSNILFKDTFAMTNLFQLGSIS